MTKQFFRKNRLVLIPLTIAIVLLALAARYTVGIVSQNTVIAQIDANIGTMEAYLTKNENAAQRITEEFQAEYAAKTRTVALLLERDDTFLTDDRTLEELRVTVNAERISVADRQGNITASTDPSGEGATLREEFRQHLSDKVYTDTRFLLEADKPVIVAASSLHGGMVQITFPAQSVVSLLQDADLANAAKDMPLYSAGLTAVIDAEDLTYISCTDTSRIGTKLEYGSERIQKKKGRFHVKNEESQWQMVHYHTSGDYMMMAIVPHAEIYHMRNVVTGWICGGGAALLVIVLLSLRMQYLREEKQKKS